MEILGLTPRRIRNGRFLYINIIKKFIFKMRTGILKELHKIFMNKKVTNLQKDKNQLLVI